MNDQQNVITPRVVLQVLFFVVLLPFLPLLISGRWNWWEAWLYAIISILSFVISRILAARRHPDLIAERARMMQHEDAEPWDRRLAPLLGLGGALALLAAGLEARFNWSQDFAMPLKIIALIIILAGNILGTYALIENRFFSGVVRLQTDRGQHVVSSGPYRWVRHPGYAGALLTYWGTPIFLDSLWTFIPVMFVTVILVVRTNLEDRTLQEKLDGYREYAGRVRYRLLPGVW
jgi:protein-S-isoprenylcysteine O-methyltransferase Ste14